MRMRSFQAACEKWDQVGRDVIERYILGLSAYLKDRIVEVWGERSLYTPRDDYHLHSAISAFCPFRGIGDEYDESKFKTFVARLEAEHRMVVRYVAFLEPPSAGPRFAVRIASRILHSREDIDRLILAMARLSAEIR
jgi:selenocysteine lyase/cysteine desulfurase